MTDHLIVGTLGRAVGLSGELELVVHSDDPSRFECGSVVLVLGSLRPLTVRSVRRHRDRVIVAFEEAVDRGSAEALRGVDLVVPVSRARTLGPDEYWDHDLVGCRVVTVGGEEVGEVTGVLHARANDMLEVTGERLIPLAGEIVRSVDLEGRVVTIDPPPGLI